MEDQNPYRSPDAVVAEISDGELADRGTRLGAAIVDTLILLVILGPLMFFGGYWSGAMAAAERGQQVGLGTTLMWAAIGFGVFVLVQFVPLNATGQTWGRRSWVSRSSTLLAPSRRSAACWVHATFPCNWWGMCRSLARYSPSSTCC